MTTINNNISPLRFSAEFLNGSTAANKALAPQQTQVGDTLVNGQPLSVLSLNSSQTSPLVVGLGEGVTQLQGDIAAGDYNAIANTNYVNVDPFIQTVGSANNFSPERLGFIENEVDQYISDHNQYWAGQEDPSQAYNYDLEGFFEKYGSAQDFSMWLVIMGARILENEQSTIKAMMKDIHEDTTAMEAQAKENPNDNGTYESQSHNVSIKLMMVKQRLDAMSQSVQTLTNILDKDARIKDNTVSKIGR